MKKRLTSAANRERLIIEPSAQRLSSRLAHPASNRSDSCRRFPVRLPGRPAPAPTHATESSSRGGVWRGHGLRAFAAAALACAALMGFSAPAQAQTEVWSGTLTVQSIGGVIFGCSNDSPGSECSTTSILSDDEFTYDSTDYTIHTIFLTNTAQLQLYFTTDLAAAAQTLTLDVAGTTFAFEDATTKAAKHRFWSRSGLSWSGGDTLALKLTEKTSTVPGAPVLTATANGETQIDLSWTVPDTGGRALDKYSIDVSADGGTTWGPQADVGSTITTYSHTGLTGGTTRHYRVAAVNPIGTGAFSNVDSATTEAAVVANNPATGSPVITGTAQVGQPLYASLGSVADADGPSIIVASYQWIRVDGATETDITGATTTPYTPVADDVGKQLKVRLSFTDDLGNPESRTSAATQAVLAAGNNAPEFTEGTSTTRSVAENTTASTNIGTAIAATDADSGDTLRYTLGGTNAASFAIVSTSGQLQTQAALDFETKSSYAVTVSVSDGNGGSDSISVTITVTDVNEQPGRPAAPSVGATANSDTSLDVSWAAPGLNGGPAITGYHLQYRQGTSGSFTNGPQNVSGTSAMISGLTAGTSYQVQVRALNGETPSDWSPSGTGSTSSTATDPTLTLDVAPTRFGEADGSAQICVVPSAPSTQRITVQVATADGTATAPDDYVSHSGPVALQPQQQRACFTVTLVDDAEVEGDETFTVRLSNPVNATLGGARAVATFTIVDNDDGANVAPTFTEGTSTTRSVAENTATGQAIGAPVAATDADSGDTLRYTLGGTDFKSFGIHLNTGQLLTLAPLDFETKSSYAVSVSVSDGNGGTDSIDVTINVTDETAPPPPPPAPDPPTAVGRLDNVALRVDGAPHAVEVAAAFGGTALTYTATSSNPAVAAVTIADAVVTVTPAAGGTTTITVTAENRAGRAAQAFTVTVAEVAPTAVGRLDNVALRVDAAPHAVEVAAAFGGTALTYTATSSNPAVAAVTIADAVVTVTPAAGGTTTITVTAENRAGRAAQAFTVTVAEVPPTAVGRLDNVGLRVDAAPHAVEVAAAFGGTALTYTATSSDPAVAAVTIAGAVVLVTPAAVGTTTVTVTAHNSADTADQPFLVTVRVSPEETQLLEDGLAALGRQTLASVTGAIGGRFVAPPTPWSSTAAGLLRGLAGAGGTRGAVTAAPAPPARLDRLFLGRSFLLPLGPAGQSGGAEAAPRGPRWAVWGASDIQSFRGAPAAGTYDGVLTSVYLGVDARVSAAWTAGVAVALSRSRTDYTVAGAARGAGTLDTRLTSLYPYLRWASATGDEVWGVFGVGLGAADHAGSSAPAATSADHGLRLGAAGWRRGLGGGGRLRVATIGDVGATRLALTHATGILAGVTATVHRVRAGLELEYTHAGVRPFVQASARFDGGDGQTGGGLEVAGGLRYAAASGLALEALGRALALHSAAGYREYGGQVTLRYAPAPDGQGLTLALSPQWGADAQSRGAAALWGGPAVPRGRPTWRRPATQAALDGEVGYGIPLPRLGGLLTPFGTVDVAAHQRLRVGFRLRAGRGAADALDLEVAAAREQFQAVSDHRVEARLRVVF